MRLSLRCGETQKSTVISNIFIDQFMPKANGEFVKIYLYLYRCITNQDKEVDLAQVADIFTCTESDILRALRYWETQKLVVLSSDTEQTQVQFMDFSPVSPQTQSKQEEPVPSVEKRPSLSADRIRALKENEEVRQMLFIAESYLGSTLSRSMTDELLYLYETLHFSVDLIDYLIEYCVSKGSGDIHYIRKVAQSWYETGIETVSQAKKDTTTYHRNYFTILKAFGITNRNPIPSEITMIDHWRKDYDFTMDILTEACSRTVAATGKANFHYADKILASWKEKGVRHLSDIQALDTLHQQLQAEKMENKSKRTTSTSNKKFNNFQQRNYDYNDLENKLLK